MNDQKNNFEICLEEAHFCNISSFSDRRILLLSKFLQKLISGSIDCHDILSLIRFKINILNTRDPKPFYPLFSTKNLQLELSY